MKRSAKAALHLTLRRSLHRRPKVAGVGSVNLISLSRPLRYDVVVRGDFFSCLGDLASRSGQRPDEVASAAREHPYFVWFEKVAMQRFRPWVLADEDLLRRQFTERVRSSMNLWSSFREHGFDIRHPVTLRSAPGPMAADSGAVVDRRLHVGDGGHRLALLLADGAEQLGPDMYRIDPRPLDGLIDNTAVLLPAIPLTVADYVRFIAHGYASPGTDTSFNKSDIEGLLEHVQQERPGMLGELERLLAAHRMRNTPSA